MQFLEEISYLGLFISSFLAATFLPFSSEAIISALYLKNQQTFLLLIIIASIGNTLGGMFNYAIGHFGKLEWAEKYLKIKQENLKRYQEIINKWGSLLAFFCWLPIIGDPLSLALGYFRVPWQKTLLFMLLGKVLRYLILLEILYLSAKSFI
jgi:membrane protein YqaA with SNARE-associated domain